MAPREARGGGEAPLAGLLRIWRQSGFTMLAAPCRQSIPRGLSSFRQPFPAGLRAHRILKNRGGISFAAFFAFWGVERPARGLCLCRSFLRLGTPAPYIVAFFTRVIVVVCLAMISLDLIGPNDIWLLRAARPSLPFAALRGDFVGVFLFSGCWPSFWWV